MEIKVSSEIFELLEDKDYAKVFNIILKELPLIKHMIDKYEVIIAEYTDLNDFNDNDKSKNNINYFKMLTVRNLYEKILERLPEKLLE